MSAGALVALDVGRARIGVAVCDHTRTLVLPIETVKRHPYKAALQHLAEIISERNPVAVVVGEPINLAGDATGSTADAISVAQDLSERVVQPFLLVDERLSTVSAASMLHSAGKSSKQQRAVIDQVAAQVILEQYLQALSAGTDISRPLPPKTDLI